MKTRFLLLAILCSLTISGASHAKPEQKQSQKIDPKQSVRDEIKRLTGFAIREERSSDEASASKMAQRAYDLAAENFGKESPEMILPEFTVGLVYSNHRDSKSALPHYEHAWALAQKYADKKGVMRTSDIEQWLFKCYLRTGNPQKGEKLIAATLNRLEKAGDYKAMQKNVMQYTKGGHCDQAAALMRRVVDTCVRKGDPLLPVLQQQIMVLLRCRRFADAIPCVEQKRDLLRTSGDVYKYADCLNELGQLNDLAERDDKSAACYKEALQLYKKQRRDKFTIAKVMKDYARVLTKLNKTKEAEALNKEADELKFGKD